MTPLHFHKYHGLGNDYLVCHRDVAEQLSNEHIQMLCHRHYGVGSDGLLIDSGDQINPTLRIINPDGSEAIALCMAMFIRLASTWGGRISIRRRCPP